MTVEFDLEFVEGIAVCSAHGPLTLDEIKQAATTMWRLMEGRQIRVLWDLRDAHFDLDTAEVRGLAEFVKGLTGSTAFRSVFVVSRDLEFGLVRPLRFAGLATMKKNTLNNKNGRRLFVQPPLSRSRL